MCDSVKKSLYPIKEINELLIITLGYFSIYFLVSSVYIFTDRNWIQLQSYP